MESDFIRQHILGAVKASLAECDGDDREARRLHAQTRLRLLMMSEDELWALACATACPPERSVEAVFAGIKESVAMYRSTRDFWIADTYAA